jgi:AraC-like DNA-binding protein
LVVDDRHAETGITATPGVLAVTVCSGRTFARHSHDQYGIGVLDAGGQRSASGRGMVEATTGDIITVNPGEVHDGAPLAGQPRRWRMLYFDESLLREAASGLADTASAAYEFTAPVLPASGARPMFERLFRAFTGECGGDGADLSKAESLLGLLAKLGNIASRDDTHGVAAGIVLAKAAIDADPAHAFSIAQLAELSGMNPFRTIRMFARATGLTPHAYLVQRRIELARDLMRRRVALADVATTAGFSDQSHLARTFVARFGYTPGTYAKAFF